MPDKWLVFAYPGDLQTLTGGYGYDRRVIAGLAANGWDVRPLSFGPGFPFPSGNTLQAVGASLSALPDDTVVIIDGLAYGVMDQAAEKHGKRLRLIALVHHPLCRENGLPSDVAARLQASESAALSHARHVIVTSPATAVQIEDLFGISKDAISTALPGTELPTQRSKASAGATRLLSIGTVTQRKGYDLLFGALSQLKEMDWHLDVVGGLEADPGCVAALKEQIKSLELTGCVTFHGAVPQEKLSDYYCSADVFVLASRYEGYGMAYAEALAHGLPVIGSGAGAVKDTLSVGGAIYCGVEDVQALTAALTTIMSNAEARERLATEARQAAHSLPSWEDAVRVFETVIEKVAQ
ncbi:glycosyltransferase family 4 protein [Roseibium sp.]|uniref:glycosyltransferase family 4 protein n=1 Tax=Roseibium sp. TaxID=1936156 RepID=UPI003D0D58F9